MTYGINCTAILLIKQRGVLGAQIEAAHRADELLAVGDLEGHAIWLRVVHMVKELTTMAPAETVH